MYTVVCCSIEVSSRRSSQATKAGWPVRQPDATDGLFPPSGTKNWVSDNPLAWPMQLTGGGGGHEEDDSRKTRGLFFYILSTGEHFPSLSFS